ncbi:hypothetical protein NM208_g4936 [Fusarium decemcellulare]|uniref:Uncharacterized protein n=1 Tax=Fusarium decemcellulare TaxID=57161 RepID=A0ACC1SIU0_9HYPO|nr:hypothetical protein NM208_g4936 [Fusarium decemcellulare]
MSLSDDEDDLSGDGNLGVPDAPNPSHHRGSNSRMNNTNQNLSNASQPCPASSHRHVRFLEELSGVRIACCCEPLGKCLPLEDLTSFQQRLISFLRTRIGKDTSKIILDDDWHRIFVCVEKESVAATELTLQHLAVDFILCQPATHTNLAEVRAVFGFGESISSLSFHNQTGDYTFWQTISIAMDKGVPVVLVDIK